MDFSVGGIMSGISNAAGWMHASAKEVPIAGRLYTLFVNKIGSPVWNLGCKTTNVAVPYLKSVFTHPSKHYFAIPLITIVGVVVIFRAALIAYLAKPEEKKKPSP